MSVTGVAPNAGTRALILFVDPDTQGHMKRLQAGTLQILG